MSKAEICIGVHAMMRKCVDVKYLLEGRTPLRPLPPFDFLTFLAGHSLGDGW